MAEWGKPLGGTYDGPEGKPRVVMPSPAELGADERATMAVFERATKSVVLYREYGDSARPLVVQSL